MRIYIKEDEEQNLLSCVMRGILAGTIRVIVEEVNEENDE